MYNCECERNEKKAKLKTTSIWSDMTNHQNRYLNSCYAPVEFILPNFSPFKMRFWEEFFFRFNTSVERNCFGSNAGYHGTGLNSGSSLKSVNNRGVGSYNGNSNSIVIGSLNFVKKEVKETKTEGEDKSKVDGREKDAEKNTAEMKESEHIVNDSWRENKM